MDPSLTSEGVSSTSEDIVAKLEEYRNRRRSHSGTFRRGSNLRPYNAELSELVNAMNENTRATFATANKGLFPVLTETTRTTKEMLDHRDGEIPEQEKVIHEDQVPVEDRSQWLAPLLLENPHFLALRERGLPLTGGFSFCHASHTKTVSALTNINRHTILELIYQHFQSIGMYKTAEILQKETGHTFQQSIQPWDRTDFHLLASLGVGHREDAWNLPKDLDHIYINETFDEDFLASRYREDPATISDEFYNPYLNVIYDKDATGTSLKDIKACSLKRFVVYFMTSTSVNNEELYAFFLSLRTITSAVHFLEHIVKLYDMEIDMSRAPYTEQQIRRIPLNIINFVKKWMECHIGTRTLKPLSQFLNRIMHDGKAKSVRTYIPSLMDAIADLSSGEKEILSREGPDPIIPNPQILFKSSLGLLDPDPTELARQITIIYHEKYASIQPLEFMISILLGKTSIQTPTLAEFFEFGNSLVMAFAEAFLNDSNKVAAFHRILEIVQALDKLNNLDALTCVVPFMQREDVLILGGATAEDKELLENIWKRTGEVCKEEYLSFTQKQFNQWAATIPNMHLEMVSGDQKAKDEPTFADGLINWGKLKPHARRCVILNRFQTQRYNLITVSQIRRLIIRGPQAPTKIIQKRLDEQYAVTME